MRNAFRRSLSLTAAAATAITYLLSAGLPVSAGGGWTVQKEPQSYTVPYDGTEHEYLFDGTNVYEDDDTLGYYLEPVLLIPSSGGGNETGGLPMNQKIKQDADGVISAEEVGVYEIRATLLDGWRWSDGSLDDITVNFEIGKKAVPRPEKKNEKLIYIPSNPVTYQFEFAEELSEECEIDASSATSGTDIGNYSVFVNLKDPDNTRWDVYDDLPSESAQIELVYTIEACSHRDEDNNSLMENGICSVCGEWEDAGWSGSSVTIDNLGQLLTYLTVYYGSSAKLTNDIVVNEDLFDENGNLVTNSSYVTLPTIDIQSDMTFNGNGHSISGLYLPSGADGLFGTNDGTIQNLVVADSYCASGVTICKTNNGTIDHCAVVDSVAGANLCGSDAGSIENSWCVDDTEVTYFEGGETVTYDAADVASGKLAYELNDKGWYQNIDEGKLDAYPVPSSDDHARVVKEFISCDTSGTKAYSNDADKTDPHTYTSDSNGFCVRCGEAQEPTSTSDWSGTTYSIENAGQLVWFARQVNDGRTDISASMTQDIDLSDIPDSAKSAFPIGSETAPYQGSFSGSHKTISGLTIDSDAENVGLFGVIGNGGWVSNLILSDADISGSGNVGAICGSLQGGSIYWSQVINSEVTSDSTSGNVGAVCGAIEDGEICSCMAYNPEDLTLDIAGSGTAVDSVSLAAESDSENGKLDADAFANGEAAWLLYQGGGGWGQRIGTDDFPLIDTLFNNIEFADDEYHYIYKVYQIALTPAYDGMPNAVYTNYDMQEFSDFLDELSAAYDYTFEENGEPFETRLLGISDADLTVTVTRTPKAIVVDASKPTDFDGTYNAAITSVDLTVYATNTDAVGEITAAVASGSTLPEGLTLKDGVLSGTPAKAGDYEVTVTLTAENGATQNITLNFAIAKKTPDTITPPTVTDPLVFGQQLADITLLNGWVWADSTTKPAIGTASYPAYLTVDDANFDYSAVEGYDPVNHRVAAKISVTTNDVVVLNGVSVTPDGMVGLNYYLIIPQEIAKNGSVVIKGIDCVDKQTGEQDTQSFEISKVTPESDGRYKFTYWVCAKQMYDKITLTVMDGAGEAVSIFSGKGENKGESFAYSVADYLKSQSESSDEKLSAFAKEMLSFGAYSNELFGYNTTSVDSEDKEDLSAFSKDLSDYAAVQNDASKLSSELTLMGMSLVLEEDNTICINFSTDGDIAEHTFVLDGEPVTTVKVNDEAPYRYAVEIENVAAKDLAEKHKLVVDGTYELTYSGLSFAAAILNNSSAAENELKIAKALYLYYEAAAAYYGA